MLDSSGSEEPSLPPLSMVGPYLIEDRIGRRGRFGITYRARDRETGVAVVLKEFFPEEFAIRLGSAMCPRSEDDRRILQFGLNSFIDQATGLTRLSHASIMRVLAVVEANDTAYYASVPVDGEKLSARLLREPRLSKDVLPALIQELAEALVHLHAAGLMHWDLRPENIRFDAQGRAVLTDFGAARHVMRFKCKPITRAISPGFAPPEVYSMNGRLGPGTDLYALAAIAYTCACGTPPPEAPQRLRNAVRMLPAAVSAIGRYPSHFLVAVDWALRLDPATRPQRASDWLDSLCGALTVPRLPQEDQVSAAMTGDKALPLGGIVANDSDITDTMARPARKLNPAFVALGVAVALALGLGFWLGRVQAPAPVQQAAPAGPTEVAAPQAGAGAAPALASGAAHAEAPAATDSLDQLAQQLALRKTPEPVVDTAPKPSPRQAAADQADQQDKLKQAEETRAHQQAELDRIAKENTELQERLKAAQLAANAAPAAEPAKQAPAPRDDGFPPGYLNSVSQAINVNLRYPPKLFADRQQGSAVVHIKIARDGRVLAVQLTSKTGQRLMDEEAKNVVWRVGRFAAVPSNVYPSQDAFDFDLPVSFTIAE